MKNTIILSSCITSSKTLVIDALYFSGTSYSKSLYPTITKEFNKRAEGFCGGGKYTSSEVDIINENNYSIKRITYTKN